MSERHAGGGGIGTGTAYRMSSSLLLPAVDVAGTSPVGPAPAGLSDPAGLIASSFGGPVPDDAASSESSSIGTLSSDDEDEDRGSDGPDEADSKSSGKDGGATAGISSLGSFSSLEDSLPIKKGLSSHFIGKSRSFSNLSECAGVSAADLVKSENPFNKRRRIQIVSRMSYKRRASCSSLVTAALPPLLSPEHALQEAEEENDDNDDSDGDGDNEGGHPSLAPTPHSGNLYNEKKIRASLKSPRSFPLFHLRCV